MPSQGGPRISATLSSSDWAQQGCLLQRRGRARSAAVSAPVGQSHGQDGASRRCGPLSPACGVRCEWVLSRGPRGGWRSRKRHPGAAGGGCVSQPRGTPWGRGDAGSSPVGWLSGLLPVCRRPGPPLCSVGQKAAHCAVPPGFLSPFSCGLTGSPLRHAGSPCCCGKASLIAPQHVGSQFPDQGSNLHPLNWKVDAYPLNHQESPQTWFS